MKEKEKLIYGKDMLSALLGAYLITFLGVILLALLLLFFQISEKAADMGILGIYITACLFAGIVIGKRRKRRKFIWGLAAGTCYYVLLIVLSLLLQGALDTTGNDIVTTMLLCMGSATLGGMLS